MNPCLAKSMYLPHPMDAPPAGIGIDVAFSVSWEVGKRRLQGLFFKQLQNKYICSAELQYNNSIIFVTG